MARRTPTPDDGLPPATPAAIAADEPDDDPDLDGLLLLEGPEYGLATFYVYRIGARGEKVAPRFENQPRYCLRFTGPFDPDRIRDECGGGDYLVMVRQKDGQLGKSVPLSIDGPARAVETPAATPAASPVAPELAQQLAELRTELRVLAAQRGSSSSSVGDLVAVMTATREMMKPASSDTPLEAAVGLFEKGIELGRSSEGKESLASVLREALPAAIDYFKGATPRPAALPAATATVSADDEAALDLVKLIVRGIRNGRAVDSMADAADEVLSDGELARINAQPVETLVAYLARFEGRFPQLRSPEGKQYAAAFFTQLRTTDAPPEAASG